MLVLTESNLFLFLIPLF